MGIAGRAAGAPGRGGDLRLGQHGGLDLGGGGVGRLQRGAGQGGDVDGQTALVELGQEGPARHRQADPGDDHEGRGDKAQHPPARQQPVDQQDVAGLERLHPARFPTHGAVGARQDVQPENRRQGKGHGKAGEQGHAISQGQRLEQPPLDARQAEQRQEDQQDDQGGEDDRALHLDRRVADDLDGRGAFALCLQLLKPQAPDDVLDHDDGVVDQHAQRDGDAAQRHGVDGAAHRIDRDQGGDHRNRNGGERHHGRAPGGQEDEDDDRDEDQPLDQRLDHIADRALDEVGLTEYFGFQLHPGRQGALDVCEDRVQLLGQGQGVGARLLLDGEDHGGAAVEGSGAALEPLADPDVADVARQHGQAALLADHDLAEFLGRGGPTDALDQQFLAVLHHDARRPVGARGLHGGDDVVHADAARAHPAGVDQQLHLTLVPADGHDLGDARNRQKPAPHGPVGDALHLGGRVRLRMQGGEHDLAHHRGGGRHHRRRQIVGQDAARGAQPLRHHPARLDRIGRPAELQRHHRQTRGRVGADAPQARRAVQRRLQWNGDQLLDLGRRIAAGVDDHLHRRRGQVGQNIDRRAQCCEGPRDRQQDGEGVDDEAVAQRPANEAFNHRGVP